VPDSSWFSLAPLFRSRAYSPLFWNLSSFSLIIPDAKKRKKKKKQSILIMCFLLVPYPELVTSLLVICPE